MKKLLVIAVILLSGCTTIHFDKNATIDTNSITVEKWHHNVIGALIEVSDPVNLEKECGSQEWSSVKTELTFINGLVSGLVNFVAPVWYPKTVEISCN
jgi:hypothetical protein